LENGRYFTPFESATGKNICLIGDQISNDLFKEIDPVGKEIKIRDEKLLL
jgi:putative ABC transport system permease protein